MPELTIKQLVERISDKKTEGNGFWLPKIQRSFVWEEEQICRLFDSILRCYPIGSMLFWYNKEQMYYRDFIKDWKGNTKAEDTYNQDADKKTIILDGQQRLQSLYIGLEGSFEGKKLYFDILSGNKREPDDMMYRFKFLKPDRKPKFPYVLFRDIVNQSSQKRDREVAQEYIAIAQTDNRKISSDEEYRIQDNIEIIRKRIEQKITYTLLDSVSNKDDYTIEDVVEIFIRANSGGTKLNKSDLLFSLLIADWEDADIHISELLNKINNYGYKFSRDFVLKTCLVLLDTGAEYNVAKFRKEGIREKLEQEWDNISSAICAVVDFVHDNTYAKTDKALTSYLALIPLMYVYYKYPQNWKDFKNKDIYIIKSLLSGTFGGHSDTVINKIIETINKVQSFDVSSVFETMRNQGYSIDITSDRMFTQMGYDSKYIHLVMNILYKGINYTPALKDNLPQIDHIFPCSKLKEVKEKNKKTGYQKQKYSNMDINMLANCMVLTQEENGSGGKSDILPEEWFKGKSTEYLELHCIPSDPKLWKMEKYKQFIKARQKLLEKRFSDYLTKDNVNE